MNFYTPVSNTGCHSIDKMGFNRLHCSIPDRLAKLDILAHRSLNSSTAVGADVSDKAY